MITVELISCVASLNGETFDEAEETIKNAIHKGCLIEQYGPYCQNCPHQINNTCPLNIR